jgi:hypothetical protein
MLSIYEIAFHLKIPIYKLLKEMPYDELLGWFHYFERRPVDWRSDDRTFKVLQTQGVKEKPWTIFGSLDAIYNNKKTVQNEDGKISLQNLKSSGIFSKMMTAVGGDKLNL